MALNLQNAKEKFINALFGVPAEIEQTEGNVQYQYPTQRQADFMQGLPSNKDLLGKIQASPYNQGYTDEEIINRVAQGQNFGLGELANEQREWGIKLPRANNELDEEAVRGNYLNVYQPKLQTGTATTPRQGGFLNDLAQGYQENATQGFNVQNLAPDQNKGLATRIGEGLGTLTRFANSPLGRGLIAYGTTRALGYDDPVEQGLIAGVTRQGNISRDKAYRQGLINMGVDEAQVNAIPGIVSDDIFKNISAARQAQLMIDYRDDMLKAQQAQNNIMNKIREASLEEDIKRNAFNQNMDLAKLGIEREKLKQGGENKPKFSEIASLRKEFTALPPVKNATEITRQYNNVYSLYAQYKQGKLGKNAFDQALITSLNKVLDPTSVVRESEFDRTSAGQAIWDKLGGYQQKLIQGGSGLTDANRADLVQALTINDSEVQNIVKEYADIATRFNMLPEDVMPRHYKPSNNYAQNSGQMKKMKSPDGKIYNVPIEKVETMKAKGGVVIDG